MGTVIDNAQSNISIITKNIDSNLDFSTEMRDLAQIGYKELENLNSIIHDITKSSNEINNFIKTIEDISFQTNLLALNAAVESARAGEHGLGFAVVSEEVRALANRSNSTSKHITELVSVSLDQSQNGLNLSIRTSKTFNNILQRIAEIRGSIDNNLDLSKKQNEEVAKIKDISENILILSSTIKNNCLNLNTMSVSLEEKSDIMKNVIGNISQTI